MRSFLSLSLAALAILAVSNAQPYNGFWKTCYYPVYLPETNPTDTLLDIICQFDTGQWTESRIYLSSCMTDDGGTLVVCWLQFHFKKMPSWLDCVQYDETCVWGSYSWNFKKWPTVLLATSIAITSIAVPIVLSSIRPKILISPVGIISQQIILANAKTGTEIINSHGLTSVSLMLFWSP